MHLAQTDYTRSLKPTLLVPNKHGSAKVIRMTPLRTCLGVGRQLLHGDAKCPEFVGGGGGKAKVHVRCELMQQQHMAKVRLGIPPSS